MLEFIQEYWLQVIFTAVISGLSFTVKYLFNRVKREHEERERKIEAESIEQKFIKGGVLAILHDSLYKTCQQYIHRGYITIRDLDNLEYLYNSYHSLGGNGTGTELYTRCKMLPIKTREVDDD